MSMGLMGRLLGLDALVEGTVRESGGRARVIARIVDVHTGRLIWSGNFEYPSQDPGEAEDRAAGEIAAQIGQRLAPATAPSPAAAPNRPSAHGQ